MNKKIKKWLLGIFAGIISGIILANYTKLLDDISLKSVDENQKATLYHTFNIKYWQFWG